jgi:chitinase
MLEDRVKGSSEAPGYSVTARHPTRLLREGQRHEILAAIEKAGFDPCAFDLTDDGSEVRAQHTMSASCFTLYRDKTWRYLGTYFVGYDPEKPFDKSWRDVIPLVSLWLAEVKGDHGALDV